jgi:hypothetical protein
VITTRIVVMLRCDQAGCSRTANVRDITKRWALNAARKHGGYIEGGYLLVLRARVAARETPPGRLVATLSGQRFDS